MIYKPNQEPLSREIERRRLRYYYPYHSALNHQIKRLRQKHSAVVVYDCHSIRSKIPFLFEGVLPDFNIGTNGEQSCCPEIQECVEKICSHSAAYSFVLNGRFKGGWTVRHYGQPAGGVHAIQIELAQSRYMQESAPWKFDERKAQKLREQLNQILVELGRAAINLSEGLKK